MNEEIPSRRLGSLGQLVKVTLQLVQLSPLFPLPPSLTIPLVLFDPVQLADQQRVDPTA
ncbi:MAG TPA: hypothetical protein VGZ22_31450 [Isosphaeraceae bacterium]|nr:hypothetical protein [Isosphaeraceae bacterium]